MEHNKLRHIYKSIIQSITDKHDIDYFMNDVDTPIFESLKYIADDKYIGKREFIDLLDLISEKKYKQDIYMILDSCKEMDVCQYNTMQRILSNKPYHKYNIEIKSDYGKYNNINKLCPHCNRQNTSYEGNSYIICGYSNGEYDMLGCGFDWCFKCEKKLCKNWQDDQLFLITNRMHDKNCCSLFAKKIGVNYETNFCLCKNSYVDRNINL